MRVEAASANIEMSLAIKASPRTYEHSTTLVLPESVDAPLTVAWAATEPALVSLNVGPHDVAMIVSLEQQSRIIDLRNATATDNPAEPGPTVLSLF